MTTSQHREAAFISAMTASATHETRNVLAIIKESAGLVEDLIRVLERKGTLDTEKVYRALERIDAQVKRGADILTNLNRLSHAVDHDMVAVDLAAEVEQVVFLSQRFARKKGHRVEVGEAEEGCPASVNPLCLQMTLFAAMERCLEELPEGSSITVGARTGEEGGMVEFRGVGEGGEGEGAQTSEGWEYLQALADALGVRVELSTDGFGIRLHFPQRTGG
jgi:C4-dicarboxylate-specific signal transduction histidine kinase